MASLATAASERAGIEAFRRDVIEGSAGALVLAYFTATWCGPCKAFGPIIERVVASYGGRVALAKIDIDKNGTIAAQLRVQSVPTVYAFLGGQPVDAFAGAVGEREVRAFIDRLLAAAPPGGGGDELEPLIEAAAAALAEGAHAEALEMYGALAAEAPERVDVGVGLARTRLALGDHGGARAALDALPAAAAGKDATVAQVRAAIELAEAAAGGGADVAAARAALAAAPDSPARAAALADALIGAGANGEAADTLLALIGRAPEWEDGAAKARLLKLFEAVGLADPWTLGQRRRLAAILFR